MKSIDEQISQAIKDGKFEDLPGEGKPLDLGENPFEDPEWSTAYRMLRNSGFTLPWIETHQEIEQMLESARADLLLAWKRRNKSLEKDFALEVVDPEWGRALLSFREQIENLNKRIFSYNIEVPTSSFQLPSLNVESEIKRIKGEGE